MYKFLFKNRWFAAGFAAMTLLSVYLLIGSEGEGSLLSRLHAGAAGQKEEIDTQIAQIEAPPSTPPVDEGFYSDESEDPYVSDEDLVEDASGIEPSPEVNDGGGDSGGDGGFSASVAPQYAADGIPIIMANRPANDSAYEE